MGARRTVLVTGFVPFDERSINTSQAVLAHIPPQIGACTIVTESLPVTWTETPRALMDAVLRVRPDVAIGLGMSRTPWVALERIATNFRARDRLDPRGARPAHERIADDGPVAYRSDLPLDAIQRRLEREGIPSRISGSAGDFLCNVAFYLLLRSRTSGVPRSAGFMHLPPLPEDGGLPLEQSLVAVVATLEEICGATGAAPHD